MKYDTQDVTEEVEEMRSSLNAFRHTAQRVVRKATESQRNLRLLLSTPPPETGVLDEGTTRERDAPAEHAKSG